MSSCRGRCSAPPWYCNPCCAAFPTERARDEHETLHLYDPDENELP